MIVEWFASREIELAMAIFVSTWPSGIGLGLPTLAGLASGTAAGALVATPARFLAPASRAVGLGIFCSGY